MTRRKSGIGLLKLGLKRPPKRVWVRHGFGFPNGYYMHRVTISSGQLVEVREWTDGSIEQVPVKIITLDNLGLKRLDSNRIVKK